MKALALLFPRFTLIDYVGPAQSWSLLPDFEIQTATPNGEAVTADMGTVIQPSHSFDSCWQAPDVLIVPGGGIGVFNALSDDSFIDTIAKIGAKSEWVCSVCNGSLLLGAAGLLRGYRAACYWHSRDYLRYFDAIPDDRRVGIDRNRATGGGMTAGVDFGIRMAAHWFGEQAGRLLELSMEYAPEPPFGVGRPELADAQTLAMAQPLVTKEMPNELVLAAAKRRGFNVN